MTRGIFQLQITAKFFYLSRIDLTEAIMYGQRFEVVPKLIDEVVKKFEWVY